MLLQLWFALQHMKNSVTLITKVLNNKFESNFIKKLNSIWQIYACPYALFK